MNCIHLIFLFFSCTIFVVVARLPPGKLIDCKVLEDGDYGFGTACNLMLIRCKQKETYYTSCDDGLIFDKEKRVCSKEGINEKCQIQKKRELSIWKDDPESFRKEHFESEKGRKQECKGEPDWHWQCSQYYYVAFV